jgi:predicted ABC-type ATPase
MMEPMGLTVGGPNGTGKTMLAEPYAEQKSMPYLAADRPSFVIESALYGRGLARRVDRTNEADRTHEARYETRIAFVVLDSVDLCLRCVQKRVPAILC